MRLILNKALDNINDNVNLKIIEITSTDFLNNDLDYFVYKYQIPLIKFTDTEEIFNVKNFKSNLNSSLSEAVIIIDETDLELISGGGGGSQDLQSVLDEGNFATFGAGNFINLMSGNFPNRYFSVAVSNDFNRNSGIDINNSGVALINSYSPTGSCIINLDEGRIGISQMDGTSNQITSLTFSNSATNNTYLLLPAKNLDGVYTLATLDDIPTSPISGTFLAPTSITVVNGLITAIS